jgi:uncharacterized protein (DUF302 family)
MNLALSTTLQTTFADAVEKTRTALQEQGFGVLTEIDMQATLRAGRPRHISRRSPRRAVP